MKIFNGLSTSTTLRWLAAFLFLYGLGVSIATRQVSFYMPDEGAHYLRAYEVSKLHLINFRGSVGVDIPCGEYTVAATKYNPIALVQKKAIDGQADATCRVRTISAAGSYSFVPYLPAALALALVERLNWTTEGKLIAARIANFTVWFSILFFSLLLLDKGRILMACLILMPSFFWQLVALSADGATFASCLAYVFFVHRIAQRKLDLNSGLVKILIALAIFIGASKGVYAPVALLAFGLWGRLSDKGWLYKFSILSLPVLAAFGTFFVLLIFSDPSLVYLGNDANPGLQITYVLQNPFSSMNLILKTIFSIDLLGLVAPTYAVPNPGRGFGIMIASILAIIVVLLNSNLEIDKTLRIVAGTSAMIVVAGFSIPIYLTYSPVGADNIFGLQGRYYLPAIPLVFIACAFKASEVDWIHIFHRFRRRVDWVIIISVLGLIVAVFNIK